MVRFRAFVSYSHADAAIAQKLHRKIETYRLPHHLRDRENDDPDNGRMGRIFRDREDLPAAEDLSESVKQALAGSEVLVVICSPDAKASIWVAREIELFRALHPGRPVLAALVRGEPEEAFPEALLHGAEPLAADLRKEGDGWRLGFLKIIAGIAGVPLDALVQRDATRRIRRVMTVTGGALVALLAMIGMTIFAIQSRNEAQHQQAEAEGLVEYMLTDLRSELKGVGRLDVMTKVNERAMDYYEDQGDLSDMPAESLERRARILHAMGEDDEKRGDLEKALAKFTEAHRVTETLLARDPDNPDRIFGHAQSEYWVGYVAYLKRDWVRAERYWQGYKTLADRLIHIDIANPKWLREAGYAEGNLCTLGLDSGKDREQTLVRCRKALKTMARLLARQPEKIELRMDVANRHAWVGGALIDLGRAKDALAEFMAQEHILRQLVRQRQGDSVLQEQQMRSTYVIAKLLLELNRQKQADEFIGRSRILAMQLANNDPENKKLKIYLTKITNFFKSRGARDEQ